MQQSRVFTERPEVLTSDMSTVWKAISDLDEMFEGRDRSTGALRWTASRVDLAFGSNSELRAIAEVYASDDASRKFVQDFAAGVQVMKPASAAAHRLQAEGHAVVTRGGRGVDLSTSKGPIRIRLP